LRCHLKMVTKLDRGARVRLDQLPERCPSLDERCSPRILAIQVQKIEGKEHDFLCGAQAVADDRKARQSLAHGFGEMNGFVSTALLFVS
jgi:hypothetical protein